MLNARFYQMNIHGIFLKSYRDSKSQRFKSEFSLERSPACVVILNTIFHVFIHKWNVENLSSDNIKLFPTPHSFLSDVHSHIHFYLSLFLLCLNKVVRLAYCNLFWFYVPFRLHLNIFFISILKCNLHHYNQNNFIPRLGGTWLWHSRQSGYFWYQRTRVRILPLHWQLLLNIYFLLTGSGKDKNKRDNIRQNGIPHWESNLRLMLKNIFWKHIFRQNR